MHNKYILKVRVDYKERREADTVCFSNIGVRVKHMTEYGCLSRGELSQLREELEKQYKAFCGMGLSLDMSRGKPGGEQLNSSDALLDALGSTCPKKAENGFDVRNYGVPDGIPECRRLFSDLLGVPAENILVCGNSSLNLMFDYISQCMTHGTGGGEPWMKQGNIKFACPVPGYDRHFSILEYFGIEMVNIPMTTEGPDMDAFEALVRDSSVKGMICVPKYSNPQGYTFSDETVRRLAAIKPAAKDFRVIWDNAYFVHDLYDTGDTLCEIFAQCKKYGNEDMIIEVVSSSKITYPGAGVSAIAASKANIAEIKKRLFVQTIGHDKVNQLRHALFLKDTDGVREHMKVQAGYLRPKFELVLEKFDKEFSGKSIAEWTKPNGGYFVNLVVPEGCAARTVALCKAAGVTLTGAGAAFPYGNDPTDSNIRIAPSFPSLDELSKAMDVLCVCVELAAVEKLLSV